MYKTKEVGIILWEKSNTHYRCLINNCNIKKNIKLEKYLKLNKLDNLILYEKITEVGQCEFLTDNKKIILQTIPEDSILEIHIPFDDNLYLLSSISHKIRNPLTNIVGILSLINETKYDKNLKNNLNIMENSSYEIISLANDIIDIINLRRNEIILQNDKVNLHKLFQECHDILNKDLSIKNLSFKVSIDQAVPLIIINDHNRLRQILINFLNNAIKFTNIGGISLEINLYNKNNIFEDPFIHTEPKKNMFNILFKIKDTGTGMELATKKLVENILEIDNNDNIKSGKYGGFGLLINKYLSRLMSGNIWFKSELNIGTVFYFNIISEAFFTYNN